MKKHCYLPHIKCQSIYFYTTLVIEFVFHYIFSACLRYENHANFRWRSTSSTGIQNQYSGYSDNLAGGAPPNIAIEFIPLSPYRVLLVAHGTCG